MDHEVHRSFLYDQAMSNAHDPSRINYHKIYERKALLAAHPELRLQLDFAPIIDLVPNFRLQCAPYSSVARGEAIPGSDIDGGVFITPTPLSVEEQLRVVQAIRNQGFSVCHPHEVVTLGHSRFDAISFRTNSELEEILSNEGLTHDTEIYLVGPILFPPKATIA